MDSEARSWAVFCICAAVVLVSFFAAAVVGTNLFNTKEYKIQSECVAAGGQFVISNGYTQCLKK